MKEAAPELSLVFAVRNCEETVARHIRAAALHVRALGRSFEIIAVNDGCRDNSLAMVRLLEREVPELRLVGRDVAGRAFVRGAMEAHGATLVLVPGTNESVSWSTLGWALARVESALDAVVLRGRYVVAKRLTCLPALCRARGDAFLFERGFERACTEADLGVAVVGARRPAPTLLAPVRRLLSAFVPRASI